MSDRRRDLATRVKHSGPRPRPRRRRRPHAAKAGGLRQRHPALAQSLQMRIGRQNEQETAVQHGPGSGRRVRIAGVTRSRDKTEEPHTDIASGRPYKCAGPGQEKLWLKGFIRMADHNLLHQGAIWV